MAKFCTNCGKELQENQDVCLSCGKMIEREVIKVDTKKTDNKHNAYRIITGIIMILLGLSLLAASSTSDYGNPVLVFGLPGLLGLISGILSLCSSKNSNLLFISGILLLLAAVVNFVGIIDISLFAIAAIIIGIFNIKYSKKK